LKVILKEANVCKHDSYIIIFPLHGIGVHLESNLMPQTCKWSYTEHSKIWFYLPIHL